MMLHNFIFSNKITYRTVRHIAFWLSRILFLNSSFSIYIYDPEKGYFSSFLFALKSIPVFVTTLEAGFCYIIIYFFVPKYFLRKKYFSFILSFVGTALGFMIIGFPVNYWLQGLGSLPAEDVYLAVWNNTRNFLIVGGPPTCMVFLSIKMLKAFYLKEEEKQALLQANAAAEIQLLKAQVHPHFLFNTLNNIYSFTLSNSPKAGEMVMQLFNMMKYMITDCNTELVPLKNELKMISNYIGLEKVRYGSRLNLQVVITGNITNKQITPLLMIPFLENSFKHGVSKMLRNPWIKLFVQADERLLHFTLSNSKPADEILSGHGGIGLDNVKKRLELLYPSNHLLTIESTVNTFTVNMQIPLFEVQK